MPECVFISIGVIFQVATFALGMCVGWKLYERNREP